MAKSKHQIPGRVRSAYEFIKALREQYSVQMMCRVLEVAPSGYYDWLQQPISNRAQEDARLLRVIRASFIAGHGIYGAARVFLDLREAGETCSKHRVARLMRHANLRALHGYRIRRQPTGKPSALIPNLLQRQFTVTRPNKASRKSAPRSPWQNAGVERFIGPVRRECLDHVIVFNAAGLRAILKSYVAYYTNSRTHLSLEKNSPSSRPISPHAHEPIIAIPQLGGLHHRYERRAA